MKERGLNIERSIFNKGYQILACNDDESIISGTKKYMEEAIKKLENPAARMGLQINKGKTNYVGMRRNNEKKNGYFEIGNEEANGKFD